MSSHYNTKIFQAMALADRILLRKKNCYLDSISDVRLDDSAFLPHIQQWMQLRTFRAAADDTQTKSRLETAVTQWLRSTHANDAPSCSARKTTMWPPITAAAWIRKPSSVRSLTVMYIRARAGFAGATATLAFC